MLDILDLACARGDRSLFEGLSFSANPGEAVHVTGQNGAGKTTLLRALAGLTRPSAGRILWGGRDTRREAADELRSHLAWIGHGNGFPPELTPDEYLASADLGARPAPQTVTAALARMGLAGHARLPSRFLSQGQKRRLALARLLAERRMLWILDEPTAGLDTASQALVVRLLEEHLSGGGIAVITAHHPITLASGVLRELALTRSNGNRFTGAGS